MRILILSINYWPEETGIGAFTTTRAEYLASVGHHVTVCTTFPYYPEWKVRTGYSGKLFRAEERNGVKILRSYSYVPERVTSVKRVVHEASFIAGSLMSALGSRRPDLLYVVSPPLGLGVSAQFLSRWWKIPYIFDVEDLQPDAAADLNMLPPLLLRAMYRIEKMAYRNAAVVSTLTNGMRERIIDKGIERDKVVLFEPCADESLETVSAEDGNRFRKQFDIGDKFVVSHSGNMGIKQGLEVIIHAAEKSRVDDSILFLIVGDGAARNSIKARAEELRLTNVRFLPLLDPMDFRGLLAATDIALVTQRKAVSDIVFPSKTVTYLGAGCPVVASVNEYSEVARAITESGAGLVVPPEDPAALIAGINQLKKGGLDNCRRVARAYAVERWSGARVLSFMEQTLARACSSPKLILRNDCA